jgi:hypothetical protein
MKNLTPKEKDQRMLIRGFLINATTEELRKEHCESQSAGNFFRADVIAELLAEEASESNTGRLDYPLDLRAGEATVEVEYKFHRDAPDPVEFVEVSGYSSADLTPEIIAELLEFYIRNEPGTIDDIEVSIKANEE